VGGVGWLERGKGRGAAGRVRGKGIGKRRG